MIVMKIVVDFSEEHHIFAFYSIITKANTHRMLDQNPISISVLSLVNPYEKSM